jgi:Holliday junction resolvasome RuvABC endonuclease subunit
MREDAVIVGLDLSLRGTGMAILVNGGLSNYFGWTDKKYLYNKNKNVLCYYKLKNNSESCRQHRMHAITYWIDWILVELIREYGNAIVAIEGPAFSKNSRGASSLYELGGIVKDSLFRACIPFRIYSPMTVKLAWTGSGTAGKDAMVDAASVLFDLDLNDLGESAEDVADAVLIAALLNEEMVFKSGKKSVETASEGMRRVMIRVTKSEPEALITRDLITNNVEFGKGMHMVSL